VLLSSRAVWSCSATLTLGRLTRRWQSWKIAGMKILCKILMAMAGLAVLIALFYAEENWRGKRAWENYKREQEAKGVVMDWNKLIPPSVPDEQNFFKAPKMGVWFVKNQSALSNELTARLANPDTTATNLNEAFAVKYLAWSDQFAPDFDLIREALKRPYARMDGNYSISYQQPIPNFVAVRIVAQTLAQRAKCDLLLGQPDRALQELTLLHDMCRMLEAAPTGKPMTLVSAMINVAVTGLYVNTLANGLESRAWNESQLAALQKQLSEIDLAPFIIGAFACEPASSTSFLEHKKPSELFNLSVIVTGSKRPETLWDKIRSLKSRWWDFVPQGWIYQNIVHYRKMNDEIPTSLFDENHLLTPKKADHEARMLEEKFDHPGLFDLFATIAIPNYSKALQTFAYNQTKANEAQIVCALERFRLARGNYPDTLDALAPQFIEKIPQDIIGGEPLHYRRTDDGNILLYSVGWNEVDDGGVVGAGKEDNRIRRAGQQRVSGLISNTGDNDRTKGDWVWP